MENPQNDNAPCLANDPSPRIDTISLRASHVIVSDKGAGRGLEGCPVPSQGTPTWIHILPHELLWLVFEFYAGTNTPVQNLVALTLVCKLWQHVVEGTPNLWRCISGMEAAPRIRKALMRAKDVLLEINYSENNAETDQATFLAEISGRIAHSRSLIIATDNPEPVITLLQTTVAPNLKTLHLKAPRFRKWDRGPVTLFRGGSAPLTLTDFRVRFIRVMVEPLCLSGLRSFELHDMPVISSEEVVRVLRASPRLERCYLSSLVSIKDFDLPEQGEELLKYKGVEGPTIKLSHLRSLALTTLPVSFVRFILSNIRAPSLQWCSVDCNIDRHDQSPASELFTAQISHLAPALTALTDKARNIDITSYSNKNWSISIGNFIIGFGGLAFQYDHLEETFGWLSNCVGRQLKALPVGLAFYELDADSRFIRLTSSLKITRLDIWGDPSPNRALDTESRDIISILSQPLASAPDQWLLPELDSINLNVINADGKFKILEMVKARHSSVEAQRKKGTGDVTLKPFREIQLRSGSHKISKKPSHNAEFLTSLQEAASGAEIWWEEVKWIDLGSVLSSNEVDSRLV